MAVEAGNEETSEIAMAALRSSLQKEVFDPSDEKLFAFTNVSRAGKKKKASFLCIAGTQKQNLAYKFRDLKLE